ncbi:MAG: hypothetical protein QOI70_900 [Microbacteriaceae bacterium]|nr:hypothetical protein [Microbacteriaceae bacterium]
MTGTSEHTPDDGDNATRSNGYYDDATQRAAMEKQTVTNDAVAGQTVWGGAGEGNDGPTGGSPRESEPIYYEHDRGGERVELDSDSRDAGSTNASAEGQDMTGTPDDALPQEPVKDATSFAEYDALTDDDEDAVNISEGDGPFLEASDDPIAGATLRKKK